MPASLRGIGPDPGIFRIGKNGAKKKAPAQREPQVGYVRSGDPDLVCVNQKL